VEEGAEIRGEEKASGEEEIDLLSGPLARMDRSKTFLLVAKVNNRIIAPSEINMQKGNQKHVGVVRHSH